MNSISAISFNFSVPPMQNTQLKYKSQFKCFLTHHYFIAIYQMITIL